MPPRKKSGGNQTKSSVRNTAKLGKVGKTDNGDRNNESKQMEAESGELASGQTSAGKYSRKTPAGSRNKKKVMVKEKSPDKAAVVKATVREDGQDMTLQVSMEQDAEFASEDNDNEGPPSGDSTFAKEPEEEVESSQNSPAYNAMEETSDAGESSVVTSSDDGEITLDISQGRSRSTSLECNQCRSKKRKQNRRAKSRSVSPRKKHCKKKRSSPRKAGRSKRRPILDERLLEQFDILKGMMEQRGYLTSEDEDRARDLSTEDDRQGRSRSRPRKRMRGNHRVQSMSDSVTTIYRQDVQPLNSTNISPTLEGVVDTSNETIELDLSASLIENTKEYVDNMPSNKRIEFVGTTREPYPRDRNELRNEAGSSRPLPPLPPQDAQGLQRAVDAIREAEMSKARMNDVSGKSDVLPHHAQTLANQPHNFGPHTQDNNNNLSNVNALTQGFAHFMMVDESFLFVAVHVDQVTKTKIINGEYVKFSKLISKDRIELEEDKRLELVNKEGRPVWIPTSDREGMLISSFAKWEQAFRVYSDIYLNSHPNKASELIQYCHVIHTASLSYQWDNIYRYDKLFRMHIECNPTRSWSVILQQAWSLCLKDKLTYNRSQEGGKLDHKDRKGKPCYKFNKGKCTYGTSCKFEHKCLACARYGHGTHNCRKFQDKEEKKDVQKLKKPN